jgi:hypothetical protein
MRLFQHAITTSLRAPKAQCDPDLAVRINSLNEITRVVNEVYAVFGAVDTFDAIVSFEDSINCFAPNRKMDKNSHYPDCTVRTIVFV